MLRVGIGGTWKTESTDENTPRTARGKSKGDKKLYLPV
jgi:hypothetical protein